MEVLGGHLEVVSAQLAATNGYSDIARGNPEAPIAIQRPAMAFEGPKWLFRGHLKAIQSHRMAIK